MSTGVPVGTNVQANNPPPATQANNTPPARNVQANNPPPPTRAPVAIGFIPYIDTMAPGARHRRYTASLTNQRNNVASAAYIERDTRPARSNGGRKTKKHMRKTKKQIRRKSMRPRRK